MKTIKMMITIIILSLFISYIFIIITSKRLESKIFRYSEVEAKRFATTIINDSINEVVDNSEYNTELLNIEKDNNGVIQSVDFNTSNVNKLLKKITEEMQQKLINIEEGNIENVDVSSMVKGHRFKHVRKGTVCEIPFGSIVGNSLLASTGPIIPIKLSFVGKISVQATTKIKEYGINGVYVELDIVVKLTERISLPTMTDDIEIKKRMPIAMKIIQGQVPTYYNDNLELETKGYTLPLQK